MFTPPPSPAPPRPARYTHADHHAAEQQPPSTKSSPASSSLSLAHLPITSSPHHHHHPNPHSPSDYQTRSSDDIIDIDIKKRVGRRIKYIIILVPVFLIFISLASSSPYWPPSFQILPSSLFGQQPSHPYPHRLETTWDHPAMRLHPQHKRSPNPNPNPQPQAGASSSSPTVPSASVSSPSTPASSASSSLSPSASTSASQTKPKVPTSPPPLPTPFPQPFDTTLSQNFSTLNCQNFFLNITQAESFRECRPFSLLQQTSNAFIQQAQTNATALNNIIWGTCNTDPSPDDCSATMQMWMAQLQSACATDLANRNAMVLQMQSGLQSYTLLRQAACLINNQTSTYCYIDALPTSDIYFYKLPLGSSLPNTVTLSCSACTKTVMGLFAGERNGSGLAVTYGGAARVAGQQCGEGYVESAGVSGAGALRVRMGVEGVVMWLVLVLSLVRMAW